jgi:glycosyltransferase involved in cell wall biosynthesis
VSPKVSVIICTRDRPNSLYRCLASIARLDYHDFDVLVVDNASNDHRTADVCRRRGTRYVVEPNVGLSRARNRGARECTSDVIAYIDDDATADPGWLSALVLEFTDPKVMVVTGAILPSENIRSTPVERALRGTWPGSARRVVDRSTPNWFEMANFGGIGIGTNMSFRRSAFGLWPGFDERLGRGATLYAGEDDYAFFSLIRSGYRAVYTPAALVHHSTLAEAHVDRSIHLRHLGGAAGYACFLFWQEPEFRMRILRFFLRRVGGLPLTWRASPCHEVSTHDALLRKLLAAWRGSVLFAHSLLSQARRPRGAIDSILKSK